MGKVVEKRGRKKKGRPSLLDLQKRNIKLQERQKHQELKNSQQLPKIQYHTPSRIHQQNPSLAAVTPASLRRSARRNPKHEANGDDDDEEDSEAAATDDDDGDLAQGQQLSGKRREKELKLVLKSPNSTSVNSKRSNSGSDSNAEDGNSGPIDRRKRKIDAIEDGSQKKDEKFLQGEEKHGSATNPANTHHEAEAAGPSMPLPDKKLLLFILDRLQKKDTYGVFAEPVDPEELPDYHEVISHPMDFGTVRKKLAGGAYANLEQFERDVCLICSNAMQYNAPDTIYFRQARSIQELAKKDFENLRQDSDNEPETKIIRRGRPPTKNLKKAFSRCLQERVKSEFAEVTLANGGENSKKADNDLKKGSNMEKYGSTNSLRDSCYNSRHGEPHSIRLVDRYDRGDEMTGSASASKGISVRHGKRQVIIDESRRNTYKQPDGSANKKEPSVLSVFDWDRKQLIPVGLHAEYGYTRSLALFAAKLGPVAWNFASRKIQRCLPNGVQFGPGWVGENDVALRRPLPQPSCIISQTLPPHHSSPRGDSSTARTVTALESSANRSLEIPGGESSTERPVFSSQSKLEADPIKPSLSSVSGVTSTSAVSPSVAITFAGPTCGKSEAVKLQPQSAFNALNSSTGKGKLEPSFQSHQNSVIQSQVNGIGINGTYGLNATLSTRKLIAASKPSGVNFQSQLMLPRVSRKENVQSSPTTEENNNSAKGAELKNWSPRSSDDCLSPQLPPSSQQSAQQQKADSAPPDLNVGFHSPGSSTTARRESTQPDLALQL